MARAWTQRTLAAAGLSLVTGIAAVALAVVGVGPLGQVAASVRDTGAAISRGVLSVVMPDADEAPAEQVVQDSDALAAPAAPRPAAAETDLADTPPAPSGDTPEQPSGSDLPDAAAVAGEPAAPGLVEALSQGLSPSAQAAGDSGPGTGIVEDVVDGVLGSVSKLTSGVLR